MSKKRQPVKVDEEKLKMMMAGDIPLKIEREDLIIEKHQDLSDENNADGQENIVVLGTPVNEDKMNKKKKSGKDKYMEIFLSRPPVKLRKQRTIMFEEDLYNKISRLIKNLPGDISFPNFLINIVNHHFETYQNDIDEILRMIADDIYNSK